MKRKIRLEEGQNPKKINPLRIDSSHSPQDSWYISIAEYFFRKIFSVILVSHPWMIVHDVLVERQRQKSLIRHYVSFFTDSSICGTVVRVRRWEVRRPSLQCPTRGEDRIEADQTPRRPGPRYRSIFERWPFFAFHDRKQTGHCHESIFWFFFFVIKRMDKFVVRHFISQWMQWMY